MVRLQVGRSMIQSARLLNQLLPGKEVFGPKITPHKLKVRSTNLNV